MNLTRGINLRKIAEMMPGASGAEVKVCVLGVLYLLWILIYALLSSKRTIKRPQYVGAVINFATGNLLIDLTK